MREWVGFVRVDLCEGVGGVREDLCEGVGLRGKWRAVLV